MDQTAQATGGEAILNRNSLALAAAHILSTDSSSYTLTYSPDNFHYDGKWHNLHIALRRSDLRLSYRRGYFADKPHPLPPGQHKLTTLLADDPKQQVTAPDLHSNPLLFEASVHPASDPTAANAEFVPLRPAAPAAQRHHSLPRRLLALHRRTLTRRDRRRLPRHRRLRRHRTRLERRAHRPDARPRPLPARARQPAAQASRRATDRSPQRRRLHRPRRLGSRQRPPRHAADPRHRRRKTEITPRRCAARYPEALASGLSATREKGASAPGVFLPQFWGRGSQDTTSLPHKIEPDRSGSLLLHHEIDPQPRDLLQVVRVTQRTLHPPASSPCLQSARSTIFFAAASSPQYIMSKVASPISPAPIVLNAFTTARPSPMLPPPRSRRFRPAERSHSNPAPWDSPHQ